MSDGTLTWRELWADTERSVQSRPIARWMCEEASGLFGTDFIFALAEPATERTVHHLDAMVRRVLAGEPVQYVLGHWSFRRLDLLVDRRVLIPRPETEQMVDLALARVRRDRATTCVDLGTGSGAIGLSLAAELPLDATTVWLTDVSADALDVARANAAGVGRKASNVRFGYGSWFDALPGNLRGKLDVVVANPPYIAEGDPEVDRSVLDWEPRGALFAGVEGLDSINQIALDVSTWLRPDGWLLLEIGHRQGTSVGEILNSAGLVDTVVETDQAGRERFAVARRPGP